MSKTFDGRDDLTPVEEIKKAEEMQGKEFLSISESEFNPQKNPQVISLMHQLDGNWKAFGQKNGKLLVTRGIKPEDVLSEFLTTS